MASGSCLPHQQVEHMTAPTRLCITYLKTLAIGAPSTHDPKRTCGDVLSRTSLALRGTGHVSDHRHGRQASAESPARVLSCQRGGLLAIWSDVNGDRLACLAVLVFDREGTGRKL